MLSQFRDDFRPRVVLALGVRRDANGKPEWYRISLPGRPNGRTGWVPAASVDVKPVRKEIVSTSATGRSSSATPGASCSAPVSRSARTGWRRRSAATT